MRNLGWVLSAVLIMLLQPASGGAQEAPAEMVKAAKAEAAVVWYTSHVPALSSALAAAFKKKYDIDVEIIRVTSGPLAQRFMAEEASGTSIADVLTASVPAFFSQARTDGLFANLTSDKLPAAEAWSESAWNGTVAVVAMSPVYLAYNTDLVKKADVPQTWASLADPKWKGQIILPDPRLTPTWLLMAYRWKQAMGAEFLQRLSNNDFMLSESVLPATQSLAAGEKSILAMTLLGVAQPLIDKGAPIALVAINPTTGLEQLAAVSRRAPHPHSARVFMNFLMSREGQSIFNRNNSASALKDVPQTVAMPPDYEAPDYVSAEKNRDGLLRDLGIH